MTSSCAFLSVAPVVVEPAETFARAGAGAVLAADPPVEGQLVDLVEQVADVEFTPVGLIAVGHARDLQMTDPAGRQVAAQVVVRSPSTIWQ